MNSYNRAPARPIYLDNHATTQVDPRVADVVARTMLHAFGNPNSIDHFYGTEALEVVLAARRQVAALVGSAADDIQFTSGATESLQLALQHAIAVSRESSTPLRVLASPVEHHALIDALREHERAGDITLHLLPVDDSAHLDLEALQVACGSGVDLVCVMAANNEVGTIYPVATVARIAGEHGASLLVDATQAAGRVPLSARAWGVSYLAISAHKMYGPKGVGALACARGSFELGRGSTPGVRRGTANVPGIAALGEACRLRRIEMDVDEPRITELRDRLEALLLGGLPELRVNGDRTSRLSNNLHVSVPGVPNDAIVARLRKQVAISTGAACSSGAQEPSHVLRAMGLDEASQEGALRIGLSRTTTREEIEVAAEAIIRTVQATQDAMRRQW